MSVVNTSSTGGIATVTMSRAEKRNALNSEMVTELHSAIGIASEDPEIRVIVLKGDGKAFCAGADLQYLQTITENSAEENLTDSIKLMELMKSIAECKKPVIAQVHGPAIAGGCGLATVCDIVVASREKAVFGYSEVKIGFIPAIVLVYLLRKVGDTHARRMVLSAQNIDAEKALQIGLISDVVDHDKLEAYTQELAHAIAQNSSTSMEYSKKMIGALHGMSVDSGLHYAAAMNAFVRQTADCKEGINNFLLKNR